MQLAGNYSLPVDARLSRLATRQHGVVSRNQFSHRAAGWLHAIPRSAPTNPIDVIATRRHQLRGLRCHRVRGLHQDDVTIMDAIPVTTVHRTFLDLAGSEFAGGPLAAVG
jgi:predicted transcriptional regulator of viral defense system